MKKVTENLKNWFFELVTGLVKHWIASLAVFLGLPTALVFFKTWLTADQSFNAVGWIWVAIFAAAAAVPIIIFLAVTTIRNHHLLTDTNDVCSALRSWLMIRIEQGDNSIETVRYTDVDKECELKAGTAKKNLPVYAKTFASLGADIRIRGQGKKTITIMFGNKHPDQSLLLSDAKDIGIALTHWFYNKGGNGGPIRVFYKEVDKECGLVLGTSKEMLAGVVEKLVQNRFCNKNGYYIKSGEIGEETMTIVFIRPEIV